jgi:hypothetical protein
LRTPFPFTFKKRTGPDTILFRSGRKDKRAEEERDSTIHGRIQKSKAQVSRLKDSRLKSDPKKDSDGFHFPAPFFFFVVLSPSHGKTTNDSFDLVSIGDDVYRLGEVERDKHTSCSPGPGERRRRKRRRGGRTREMFVKDLEGSCCCCCSDQSLFLTKAAVFIHKQVRLEHRTSGPPLSRRCWSRFMLGFREVCPAFTIQKKEQKNSPKSTHNKE